MNGKENACVTKCSDLEELQRNIHEFEKILESTKERFGLLVESLRLNSTVGPEVEDSKVEMSEIPTNKIKNIKTDFERFTQIVQDINLELSCLENILK